MSLYNSYVHATRPERSKLVAQGYGAYPDKKEKPEAPNAVFGRSSSAIAGMLVAYPGAMTRNTVVSTASNGDTDTLNATGTDESTLPVGRNGED